MLEINHIGDSRIHETFIAGQGVRLLSVHDGELAKLMPWSHMSLYFPGEHCTECAAPDCHRTCDFFECAPSGYCRRFADGIVARPVAAAPVSHVLEILFKPWGRLLCVGNYLCIRHEHVRFWQSLLVGLGKLLGTVQALFRFFPEQAHWAVADKIRGAANLIPRMLNSMAAAHNTVHPEALALVLGNPHPFDIAVDLTVSGFGDSQGGKAWRRGLTLRYGWNVVEFPCSEIGMFIDFARLFRIAVAPRAEEQVVLQVAYIGFVAGNLPAKVPVKEPVGGGDSTGNKIKLLVVDLDNTLWNGILLENEGRIDSLRPGVGKVLHDLDQRGILLSIVSKNNFDDARRILENLGVWDLFLFPQICWEPKSTGIQVIAHTLNIAMDTVAFIDDSAFERAEVSEALPDVRVYDETRFEELLHAPECDVPVTDESRRRRQMYREEQERHVEFEGAHLDYDIFLKSCNITLTLLPLCGTNVERVYELVQRTNQLNFSGNRYTREALSSLLYSREVIPVVMLCEDRFGSYGVIGFSILEKAGEDLVMNDLMLSCRIQGKKVEHAYLSFLFEETVKSGGERLVCKYNRTGRNLPAAHVFDDLGFEVAALEGGRELYMMKRGCCPLRMTPFVAVIDHVLGAGGDS